MSCDRQAETIRVRFCAGMGVGVCVGGGGMNGYLVVIFSTAN